MLARLIGPATKAPDSAGAEGLLVHPVFLRLLSAVLVLGAWEVGGRVPISPAFPPFSASFAALLAMLADGSLLKGLWVTLQPLALGLAISGSAGIAIGIAMGLSRLTEWLIAPIFIVMQAAPLAALIPILTFAYGIGLTSKVLTVCIMAMPVVVLNAFSAVRYTPRSLIEMSDVFLASRRQQILHIILPAASPVIFAGLRLGAAAGFVGAILAELLITPTGVGDIITYSQSIADYPSMYAAIASVIVFSVLVVESLEWLEARLFRPDKRAI